MEAPKKKGYKPFPFEEDSTRQLLPELPLPQLLKNLCSTFKFTEGDVVIESILRLSNSIARNTMTIKSPSVAYSLTSKNMPVMAGQSPATEKRMLNQLLMYVVTFSLITHFSQDSTLKQSVTELRNNQANSLQESGRQYMTTSIAHFSTTISEASLPSLPHSLKPRVTTQCLL
jgi:hypothetical protein